MPPGWSRTPLKRLCNRGWITAFTVFNLAACSQSTFSPTWLRWRAGPGNTLLIAQQRLDGNPLHADTEIHELVVSDPRPTRR
jgi:hypothetical protein